MIAFGTGFDVSAIFFTHFHADHWVGAIGFLRTLSMAGRERPLDLYGPRPARRLLETVLFAGTDAFGYEVRIHEVEPGAEVRREGARFEAFPVDHRIASVLLRLPRQSALMRKGKRDGKGAKKKRRFLGRKGEESVVTVTEKAWRILIPWLLETGRCYVSPNGSVETVPFVKDDQPPLDFHLLLERIPRRGDFHLTCRS